ncbi:chitinase 2-like [Paramuricea clavata]|uniref:Chitinase 2-like n=1 Tax=Paramuricea clavata TaxID=317549 RepID=A0A7D9IPV0_PARCT|nr:chitinase 2-like [Paramuricea clavata]
MEMSRSSVALLILVNFLQVLEGGDCIIIGTYLGALPNGVRPPALSSIHPQDVSYNGNFQPFSEWTRLGITKRSISITADKGNNPNRKYVISLGGAANFGGTFRIRQGLTVEQWVTNAVASISQILTNLSADGVDIPQFYAKNLGNVNSVVTDITQAANDLGGWSKLVAGFNSNNRNPNPTVSLQAFQRLKRNLQGTFTWAAEISKSKSSTILH